MLMGEGGKLIIDIRGGGGGGNANERVSSF